MFIYCWSWPPVKVNHFRPFLSYMETPWAPGHMSKREVGTSGSIAAFCARGAMMHSMNFRTSKQNFYRKLFVMGGQCAVAKSYHGTIKLSILREGPRSQDASWGVCGSGVPPYDFLNLYGVFNSRFSIKVPQLLSLRPHLKAL
jgi:hypothetical protein